MECEFFKTSARTAFNMEISNRLLLNRFRKTPADGWLADFWKVDFCHWTPRFATWWSNGKNCRSNSHRRLPEDFGASFHVRHVGHGQQLIILWFLSEETWKTNLEMIRLHCWAKTIPSFPFELTRYSNIIMFFFYPPLWTNCDSDDFTNIQPTAWRLWDNGMGHVFILFLKTSL